MLLSYNTRQMLDLWRLRRGYEPLRSDGIVVRRDGLDTDALWLAEIDVWYADLLANAPLEMVEVTDIASEVSLTLEGDCGYCILPDRCYRVVEVMGRGWERPVVPVAPDAVDPLDLNEFVGCGADNPLAIVDGRRLIVRHPGGTHPARLLAVMRPDDDTYRFHDQALSLINRE